MSIPVIALCQLKRFASAAVKPHEDPQSHHVTARRVDGTERRFRSSFEAEAWLDADGCCDYCCQQAP